MTNIDGVKLTDAQVMSMRVAMSSFIMDLSSNGLSDDEHGKAMTAGYLSHCRAMTRMLVDGANRPDRLAARQKEWGAP